MTSPSREIPYQCRTLGCKKMTHNYYCFACETQRKAKKK